MQLLLCCGAVHILIVLISAADVYMLLTERRKRKSHSVKNRSTLKQRSVSPHRCDYILTVSLDWCDYVLTV